MVLRPRAPDGVNLSAPRVIWATVPTEFRAGVEGRPADVDHLKLHH